MSGKNIRIKRLFNSKKKIVISALDHVVEYGFQPGIEDARKAIANCMATDALLLSRFMLKRNWDMFTSLDSPSPVVRINWSSSFYYPLEYREGFTTICTNVEEAVEAGAEAVICSLFLEEKNNRAMEVNNVAIFSEVVRQKEKLGIPLIGECYVVEHAEKKPQQVHDKVKRISRIMSELGADFIKTFYTGENFHEVVENTPVPIFTIGAEKLNTDIEVLEKAYNSVKQGSCGIIFGRNIFMADNPPLLIKALNEVMNDGITTKQAAEKYGLK